MGVFEKLLERIRMTDTEYDEDDYPEESYDDADDVDEDDYDDSDNLYTEEDSKDRGGKRWRDLFSGKKRAEKEEQETEEEEEEKENASSASKNNTRTAAKTERTQRTSSKITPIKNRRSGQYASMEVCVIKPASMEDAQEISDTLLENCTVILNLEGQDVELAQRIIDYTSGACYSLKGHLQQISNVIFVVVPYNVQITGDLGNLASSASPSVKAGY